MNKKKYSDILTLGLCLMTMVGLCLGLLPQLASPVQAADLDELLAQQEAIDAQISAASSELNSLNAELDEAQGNYNWLSQRSQDQQEQFRALSEEKEHALKYQQSLLANLEVAKRNLDQKKDQYGDRVESMFELQDKSWMELLLEAESLQGFFTTVKFMKLVTESDEQALDDLLRAQQDLEKLIKDTNEQVENLKNHIAETQAEMDKIKADMNYYSSVIADASWSIKAKHNEIAEYEGQSSEIAGQIAEVQERLKREAEEEARREEARRQAEQSASNNQSSGSGESDNAGSSSGGAAQPGHSSGGFIWPCPSSYYITSYFGPRDMFGRSFHYGLDIAAGYGASVVASKSGTVVACGWYGGYGNYIMIDHGDGTATAYGHMQGYNTSSGASVGAGEVIGFVGSTGDSTGPHLHFEILEGGVQVNPLNYVG